MGINIEMTVHIHVLTVWHNTINSTPIWVYPCWLIDTALLYGSVYIQ